MALSLVQIDDSDARVNARTNLFLGATILFAGQLAPVRVRDLSRVGAKVEGTMLPATGMEAQLKRGKLTARGEVAWCDGVRCGLRFLDPINLHAWLPRTEPTRSQADVDQAIAQVRAGKPADADTNGQALTDLANLLPARLAEEITCVVRTLETVQHRLASQPALLARHGVELQRIDMSSQLLAQIAALLIAPDLRQAVETIATEGLRRRLVRGSL